MNLSCTCKECVDSYISELLFWQLIIGGLAFHLVPLGLYCVEPKTCDLSLQKKTEKLEVSENCDILNKNLSAPSEKVQESTSRKRGKIPKCPLLHCVNWSIFKNFTVIIVIIYTGIAGVIFSSHFAYCGALVQQNGLTEKEASYLLSISGITDLVGNAAFGLLFDTQYIKKRRTTCYAIMNALLASVVIILPFLKSFEVYSIAFGLWGVFAVTNTIRNVLLSNHVKNREQLADAVGVSLLSSAIGFGTGPFITGKFFNTQLYICSCTLI